jgi:replicative superfamily II helicase
MAKQDIEEGKEPADAFNSLSRQCLGRDEDWKTFYTEQMKEVKPTGANESLLHIYENELKAEQAYSNDDYGTATQILQNLLDKDMVDSKDKGWYLQQMARYNYRFNRPESQRLQISAHKAKRLLLKPSDGVTVAKLTIVSQGRIERIINWVHQFEDYSELEVSLSDILGRLVFGTKADRFEQAINEISSAIGFVGERPDKEWKAGPDNLWALDDSQYIIWECKNEVDTKRSEINKGEAEQMNRSSSWFEKHYLGMKVKRIIIHPTHVVARAASFTHEVEAMREAELKKLVKQLREFFKSFESLEFKNLSTAHIQKLIELYHLSLPSLLADYSKKLKNFE